MMDAHDDRVRVLIVDDSTLNRRGIRRVLESSGCVQVVGEASDGDEALRMVTNREPEAITLDLEMPRLDGFSFLRILMARKPLPVIVVSSHSQKENVFRALELGAIDFVEKPEHGFFDEQAAQQLVDKVLLARTLRPVQAHTPPIFASEPDTARGLGTVATTPLPPRFVVAIAASTGDPTALLDVFSRLPSRISAAILVAQHMPPRFTGAFAARLDRKSALTVREASDGEALLARHGYVCPGGKCMEVEANQGEMRLRVQPPNRNDGYVPSADRLFKSVAQIAKSRAIAVVLTGMGTDGVQGAKAIRDGRGLVIVESAETAVVDGMPSAVIRAGVASRVLPLPAIGELLATLTG